MRLQTNLMRDRLDDIQLPRMTSTCALSIFSWDDPHLKYQVDRLHTQPIHAVDLNSFEWLQTTFGRDGEEIIFQAC